MNIYKVGDTIYRINLIYSMSKMRVRDNRCTVCINGCEISWYIGYTHLKPEYKIEAIMNDETIKEYITMYNKFSGVDYGQEIFIRGDW